jgi:hypothetical protein
MPVDPEVVRCRYRTRINDWRVATGKPIVDKVLSPAAMYVGKSLRDLSGSANMRVLKAVVETSPVCDDSLLQEYLAAVLAASRSVDGTEDDSALQPAAILRDVPKPGAIRRHSDR